ncbi:MAG: ATP-binding cassette domain-containing protein [Rhodospirillaceae bacterium]|nr:ATP-binding cassette domain-containing protein [Rhodospirillaceae bacterium]
MRRRAARVTDLTQAIAPRPDISPLAAPLIAGRHIRYEADGQVILDHVDIHVRPREIVTLIGPNGAGKSTLVRILLGLLEPSAGTVERRPGLRVGYVPQRFSPSPHMPITARRFLATAQGSARHKNGALTERLTEVGAAAVADTLLNDLSSGELQRVLLARALIGDPDLLVLDEPTRGVDVTGQTELFDLVAGLRDSRGCGMLIVSHELHIVMAATDRVLCLNKHICCEGRPESISTNPEFVAMFGTAAARRLAIYTHEHDHQHDIAGEVVHAAHGHETHNHNTHVNGAHAHDTRATDPHAG